MTTPQPGHEPMRLHFPDPQGRLGHRLSGTAIAAIIAVTLLVVAACTTAVLLSGSRTRPAPAPMLPAAHEAAQHVLDETSSKATGSVALVAATAIDLGNGVSLAPASGWTVQNHGSGSVLLLNPDSNAQLFATVGKASDSDILTELHNDINATISGSEGVFANVKVAKPLTKRLQGNNFQQEAGVAYTADVSTQQGTSQANGVFVELLDLQAGNSAFLNLTALSADALSSATAATDSMINSML